MVAVNRKIVVFTDVEDKQVLEVIREVAGDAETIQLEKSFAYEFMWRGKHTPYRVGTPMCFITEKTVEDADVVFAVYSKRVPVLSLTTGGETTNLLETISSLGIECKQNTSETWADAVRAFLPNNNSESAVIVFEGGDGAGKATQTEYMRKRLDKEGKAHASLDFPSDKHRYGKLIRKVLSGERGALHDLDPKLFSLLFSLNRFDTLPELRYWLTHGKKILLDRYYTSNFGHQASKLEESERSDFIRHLEQLELEWLKLPPPDVALYLDLPPAAALVAMQRDEKRESLDIHETAGLSYKENVRQTYVWCCQNQRNWVQIECCNDEGERYSREKVHEMIYNAVAKHI
ncbi:thymidylate kinase, putative [Trypanosoma equiperdum]|uniref:dTMP kinase n=2 Tax=Trypanozoon TaxID=39700 RepID=Q581B1_TRYB2|nr:thymidylate kinase, putative [Trypanosoma brucei brucei TREU927]AAX78942.1 thymidylate kinase, putative [Trypanosoma brucei]AAZ13156.1 thymidylate kinase, putative [Trypanosoma brucei brucei TREU927]SCU64490.1 thymidylate kinase, putative [Trypanosoma equiperdum]